ncbi:MAG TPA: UpxY family transcription antiterminator [Paludibaculum sp.]
MEERTDSEITCEAGAANEGSGPARWFAVTVRPQHEQSAQKGLEAKGLETYLPLYLAVRQWSDRTKTLQLPLFPGYVFCRFDRTQHTAVVRTPGVRAIVSFGGEPAPVPEVELESVRKILSSGSQVEPWPFLAAGQRIRIVSGPLKGMEGTLVETPESCRLVVSIEMFQRSCAVRVDRENVVVLAG